MADLLPGLAALLILLAVAALIRAADTGRRP